MGEVIEGQFPIGLSLVAEAKQRGCTPSTVWAERRGEELPPYSHGINGKLYRSRQLTCYQRKKRDRYIRIALESGLTVAWIEEHMHVSRGVISKSASGRRKGGKYISSAAAIGLIAATCGQRAERLSKPR